MAGSRNLMKFMAYILTLGCTFWLMISWQSTVLAQSDSGEWVGEPCLSNFDCWWLVEYCEKPVGLCDGEGLCAERPQFCYDIWAPVCGCDGCTYSNDCWAAAAGVSIAYYGPCADPCKCDLNGDGRCDMQDWLLFGEDWGRTDCCDPGVECECDLNNDCKCDMEDWPLFGEDWGRTDCPL